MSRTVPEAVCAMPVEASDEDAALGSPGGRSCAGARGTQCAGVRPCLCSPLMGSVWEGGKLSSNKGRQHLAQVPPSYGFSQGDEVRAQWHRAPSDGRDLTTCVRDTKR